ncbi:MAG: AbrB/MazE/SpoVT family DNA-binding domain-containing protein [Chloroflexia bacterium]|jgi:AbrB family looped-hinge helix DNA binding protein|nr:AbrB/MazE/SpoVT family DNA-binding domain-containing protein [Chloroflexia bacterium]
MVIRTVNVRQKGQMTLPADVRDQLGVQNGGKLLLERQENHWILVRADDLVDRTAGALAEYAMNVPLLTPAEMREAAAEAIAEENLETLRQIDQDRENH